MAILQDNRKVQAMTVEDADGLFKRMVALKAAMRREEAAKTSASRSSRSSTTTPSPSL